MSETSLIGGCAPCRKRDSVPLKISEIKGALPNLKEWKYSPDFKAVSKEFHFDTYVEGVDFAVDVARISENLNHHPQINIGYKWVSIEITTHTVGGLTHNDFNLAANIDGII